MTIKPGLQIICEILFTEMVGGLLCFRDTSGFGFCAEQLI